MKHKSAVTAQNGRRKRDRASASDKNERSVAQIICNTIFRHPAFSILLVVVIVFSVVCALLPPLVLEKIVNTLTAGDSFLFSTAVGYFLITAASGLLDAAKESLITAFGQKATHRIRSVMSEKLKRLPAAYFVGQEPGVTASRFVNDVNTVDNLFTSGIISMAADLCRLISILMIIFTKSVGLGLMLLAVTPLLFWMTRVFQKRMLNAQLENRVAVGRINQQIPETLKNMRTIRVLRQESYMLSRYGDMIEQGFRAQDRSNFYDAVYSPIIVSVSALLVGILMAASGTAQVLFGMSAGTAAAVMAYVGNFFTPLESIGMEIQNVQSAVAGVRRIDEFLREEEQTKRRKEETKTEQSCMEEQEAPERETNGFSKSGAAHEPGENRNREGKTAVQLSDVCFRYQENELKILDHFYMTVKISDSVILTGRTGAGKSTLVRLIAGLYQPQQGEVRIFGKSPEAIPEAERRHYFGYVEQQLRLIAGTVADQVSLKDPQVTKAQIRHALDLVGLSKTVDALPDGMNTPCTENLLSQGQLQLLAIARAVVSDPKILLLDEITANLDAQTEAMVLAAISAAAANRTVISVSHRLYEGKDGAHARIVYL